MILKYNLLNYSKLYYIHHSKTEGLFSIGVLNQLFDMLLILKKSWFRALGAINQLFFYDWFFRVWKCINYPLYTPGKQQIKN